MTDSHYAPPERYPNGRFGPGNPGRPVGAYGRASRRAALAILEHFEANRPDFLEKVMDRPDLYIKLLSRLLPRQIEISMSDTDHLDEAELARVFGQARVLLSGHGDRRAAMVELESLMLGEARHGAPDRNYGR